MQIFEPSEADLKILRSAAVKLKQANSDIARATKEVDTAKKAIAEWLKDNRDTDVETLKIGDMVLIKDAVMIEIGKRNKFDEAGFSMAQPAVHAQFKKDFPSKHFKALV